MQWKRSLFCTGQTVACLIIASCGTDYGAPDNAPPPDDGVGEVTAQVGSTIRFPFQNPAVAVPPSAWTEDQGVDIATVGTAPGPGCTAHEQQVCAGSHQSCHQHVCTNG
jgi:hypothetical protein